MNYRLGKASGFTKLDLIGVIGTVVLLLAWQIAAAAVTRSRAHTLRCLGNHRQMALAWLLYAQENEGKLPGNSSSTFPNQTWCSGWLDFNSANAGNTNVSLITTGQLGRFVGKNKNIFHCPADPAAVGQARLPRFRSISMNVYLGGSDGISWGPGYRQFMRLDQLIKPLPREAFVFICERDDSINDPEFVVGMLGAEPPTPSAYSIVDYPAPWHEQGSNLSFADGHAENWHWLDRRTMPSHKPGQLLPLNVASPNNPDVARLQSASSSRR